jgi:SAM-dependent methyltransferase
MRLAEKLLLSLSGKPGSSDYEAVQEEWNLDNALYLLCRVFPDFMGIIVGKEILDVGCGTGYQSVALARGGAKYVLGIDKNQKVLKKAQDLARELGLGEQVEFADKLEDRFRGRFDIVISQNSMEHFGDPVSALSEMKTALNQDGKLLITFGPPWFSPHGSHMPFPNKIPWVNILFSERTVMNVRACFRDDGAARYEEVESGLNKMTVAKFERIISDSGMKIQYRRYDCVKGLNFLGKPPLIRELFINFISCVLTKCA